MWLVSIQHPPEMVSGSIKEGKIIMTNFSNRLVAALSSIALTAAFLAFAIAPASQNVIHSGIFA
jgi:hypothetical protein